MPGPFLNYSPHPSFVILAFALLLGAVMLVLRFVFVGFAFERLGISRGAAVLLLWLSLLGSNVNIPVAQMPAQNMEQDTAISAFGMIYIIPRIVEVGRTIIAVNLGGAIIPVLFSLYLMFRYGLGLAMLAAIAFVTFVVHMVAHPVGGVGIVMPPLIASAAAAVAAVILGRSQAARVAFVSGTLGTLIGADLLNLGKLNLMNAPVVSIGGAGTFDGVFITGIVAVLLAGLRSGGPRDEPQPI
jgi:uncharacterized membrane protein